MNNLWNRSVGPFDEAAVQRHRHMGLLDCNGDVNADAVNFLAHLCAGLFFDALCDSYVEMQTVSRICQAFCKSENVEAQRVVLMICSEYKGAGDIICCLDESSSTAGECAAWGKAVAMTLLEIAESEGRRFALIHFSDFGTIKTDLFFPKQTTVEDRLRAAETFLDGGTDFCAPLNEALRLMEEKDFENADIVFITDGECVLPPEFISRLQEEQVRRRFTITGILLDQGYAGMDFSLRAFCQSIYRTSELTGEAIVYEMVNDLIQI